MKAVGFTHYLPIEIESAFLDLDIEKHNRKAEMFW